MVIYKTYNQQELDLQFNNRFHVPDFNNYLQHWEKLSRQTEKKLKVFKDIPYGISIRECLDVYPSLKPGSKTLVFIHGGYWQRFDKLLFHFIAKTFYNYGVTTVLINYPLAPDVKMDEIVISCRKAIDWIYNNIATYNGNMNKIYIAGHSAGAHLAAMLLLQGNAQSNLHFIKGMYGISGLYNLVPIHLSDINDSLKLDSEMAIDNSPALKEPLNICDVVLACGAKETDEFIDQSRQLKNNWQNKIPSIELTEIAGLNHFSILSSIIDTCSVLHQSLCKLMKI
jgi:arylformamidase